MKVNSFGFVLIGLALLFGIQACLVFYGVKEDIQQVHVPI